MRKRYIVNPEVEGIIDDMTAQDAIKVIGGDGGKTGGNWDSAPEVTGTLFDDVAKLMIFSETVAF